MKNFNPKKRIEDPNDLEGYCSELFESFLDTFTRENGLIRDLEEDDPFTPDEVQFMHTNRGTRLARKMLRLLQNVCNEHYPNESFYISSQLFREP